MIGYEIIKPKHYFLRNIYEKTVRSVFIFFQRATNVQFIHSINSFVKHSLAAGL